MTGSTCCRQDKRAAEARACTEVMEPFLVVVMRLLQAAQVSRQRGLVPHRRRNAPQQRRHLRVGLPHVPHHTELHGPHTLLRAPFQNRNQDTVN